MLKIVRALYLFLNVAIILAFLAIHFIYKEDSYQSSLLYYSFPLPIIILAVLVLSIFLNRKFRKFNLLIALLLLLIWLGRSFKIKLSEEIKESDLEIVFWNASRNNDFEDAFNINKGIPHLFVLVELNKNNMKTLQLEYPDYHFYFSEEEIAVFSKKPIKINLESTTKYNSTIINFETNDINFYVIDITGSQDVPRSWELGFVNENIKIKEKTILLGDFNVPYESKYLSDLKTNFNHAFNKKGNGFRETWFWNIPLLSLDHIWVSKDLKIIKTKKTGTFKSDHSMLKTYIRK
ncbi:endonuclease/exonuclease/phosphatase family protein [Sabulilitoribacter arenilitoris]|uniref:Endonuclease/exonuclease/phosphatase family protein n=1 Tax=Wocania arenilitoris TaxID=2044858 RepID=A0AAE3JM16_9FLAO|nr:endonuclease/exonuclease/phosphatase family protein [Wocania arenilitoris]MCF7567321.1 endonuclease/exonuclease/phosphatase family protein [Wocania arenilitoris]